MADPNITCHRHNKVHEFICDIPSCGNGLCLDCWNISDQHKHIMSSGINFLCHECILMIIQRKNKSNQTDPNSQNGQHTDSNNTINRSCENNSISNDNRPSNYTAEKVRDLDNNVIIDNIPNNVTVDKVMGTGKELINDNDVMSPSRFRDVNSIRKQLFPREDEDTANDNQSINTTVREKHTHNKDTLIVYVKMLNLLTMMIITP